MSAPTTEPVARRRLTAAYYPILFVLTLVAAYRLSGLAGQSLRIPLSYEGDGLSGEASFKAVLETGWYERNPALGAPWGQTFHDFPLADNLHLMAAHVLGWFTDDVGVAVNVYYLLTFPLAAVAGAWFVRVAGGSRTVAFAAGVLFAFAPYHFVRNENQLYLSAYYVVPLGAAVILKALAGTPLWVRRDWGTVGTLACLVLLGTASSYYSVFTLLLLGVVVLARLLAQIGSGLRPALRGVAGSVAAMVVLVVVMVANMLPDLLYTRDRPPNFVGLTRNTLGTEIYALKLAQLVLPVSWERLGPLRDLRSDYDATFPLPSEQPQLGLVAAAGFLGLLLVVAVALVRAGRPATDTDTDTDIGTWATQRRLALLNLVGFLFGTVGGLSTLFALFVSDGIRGWNRIAIFLALFSLASLALALDAGVRRATTRSGRPGAATALTAVVALGVTLGGLYDQVPPVSAARQSQVTREFRSDAAYVAAIQRALPSGAMVYQEPYLAFPESPPLLRMTDADPLRPYLHSTDLRWSYGGITVLPQVDWAAAVDQDPLPRRLVELAAAGFDGIHVDRYGYTAEAASTLERQLAQRLGVTPVVSRDQRFLFFDLTGYRAALDRRYPAAELAEIGSHAVSHPVAYFQRDYKGIGVDDFGVQTVRSLTDRGTVFVDNPRSTPARVQIQLGVSVQRPGRTRITWPDGSTQTLPLTGAPTGLSRSVLLPPGRTALSLAPAPGATGSRIRLTGLSVRDDVLASFALR